MNSQKAYGCQVIFVGMILLMLIGCVRVKVETAGHKKSLSEVITQRGDRTGESLEYCEVLPFSQQSEVVHSLPVTKHPNVTLSSNEADEILAEATKVAREGGGNDFRCKVTLKRETSVPINEIGTSSDMIADFQWSPGALVHPDGCVFFGEICSKFDFETMKALDPKGVKVVEEITWCNKTATQLVGGCADRPGHSLAVIRPPCNGGSCPKLEGVLWLHEYGHNRNIAHRRVDDPEPAVMYPGVSSQHTSLNKCECQKLRN